MKQYITAAILILAAFACTAGAADHDVYENDSIQVAINSANAGDTIYVHIGTYTENIIVNKTLTLRGDGADVVTVQAASAAEHVFNVTADYVNIAGFTATGATGNTKAGFYLGNGVDHCNVSYNNALNSNRSIYLNSSSNNTLTGNIANSGDYRGILLSDSSNNTLRRNTASGNIRGIYLRHSSNNRLANNVMTGNSYNFGILGENPSHYIQKIDTSNTVGGKPIYYGVGLHDQEVSDDAGYVGIVNSTNMTVRDMRLTGNLQGVLLVYSTGSTITNITGYNGQCGIYLYNSTNNRVVDNNVFDNTYGIYIEHSCNNTITKNVANSNTLYNIDLVASSNNNTVSDNNASGGDYCGIAIGLASSNNTVVNNTANSNGPGGAGGILLYASCEYNNIMNNIVSSNDGHAGIFIFDSCRHNNIMDNTINSNIGAYGGGIGLYNNLNNNVIAGNTVIDNTPNGMWFYNSNSNFIYNNYFANTVNAHDDGTGNIWNTTPTTGPNIVGGPEIGGNYWSDYAGTDNNNDGFGDTLHLIGSSNRDYLPLVMPMCGDITGDGNIDTVDLLHLLEHVVTGTHVHACVGDIDGNGHINVLDVRLLMGYINDSTGYSLNCGC